MGTAPGNKDGAGREEQLRSEAAHHESVAQPHRDAEGPVAEAEMTAARISTDEQPLGRPGRPVDRRSPFIVGMEGAAGVAITIGLIEVFVTARDVLVLIGLALFIAVGLEPAVSWLTRVGLPRWAAVTAVLGGLLAAAVGFFAAAIPPLVDQAAAFVSKAPSYLQTLTDHSSFVGQLNDRFHLQQSLEQTLNGGGGNVLGGVLGAGVVVLSALGSMLLVGVLTVYFLAALPRLRAGSYRLVPHSRRPRVILLGDEIAARVGGYVLGNVVVSVIAAALTFLWLLIFGVPYPLLLAILVALLDLIPTIGSTAAGVLVSLVALTVSLPVALATAAFFIIYRFVEDYLLVPKIIGAAVKVSALATVVAVLLGGVLFGVIGALVAIPIAAAVQLIVREVAIPRLDRT
jgi:predicted PurR-regulated permease PerM